MTAQNTLMSLLLGADGYPRPVRSQRETLQFHLDNLLKIPKRRRGNRQNHEIKVLKFRLGVGVSE